MYNIIIDDLYEIQIDISKYIDVTNFFSLCPFWAHCAPGGGNSKIIHPWSVVYFPRLTWPWILLMHIRRGANSGQLEILAVKLFYLFAIYFHNIICFRKTKSAVWILIRPFVSCFSYDSEPWKCQLKSSNLILQKIHHYPQFIIIDIIFHYLVISIDNKIEDKNNCLNLSTVISFRHSNQKGPKK